MKKPPPGLFWFLSGACAALALDDLLFHSVEIAPWLLLGAFGMAVGALSAELDRARSTR